jgi:hypothetical protein
LSETTNVVVEKTAEVDPHRPEVKVAARNKALEDLSMEEYAAFRNAEERAKATGNELPKLDTAKPEEPAVATEPEKPAATEEPAATDDEDEEGEDAEAAAAEPEAGKKRSKGIDRKFSKLTKAIERANEESRSARETSERLQRENEALQAKLNTPPPSSVPEAKDDPAPKQEDFEDPNEFEEARSAHTARSEIRKAEQTAAKAHAERTEAEKKAADERNQKAAAEAVAQLHKTFNERCEAAKTELPDFETKVMNNDKLTLENVAFFACERLPMGPHILYYLAEHPDEIPALNALAKGPSFELATRLGEIQADIRAARKPKTTKAAAPIEPINTGRSEAERVKDEDLSMEQFAEKRNAEEAARRKQAHGQRSNARH